MISNSPGFVRISGSFGFSTNVVSLWPAWIEKSLRYAHGLGRQANETLTIVP
jgi:hypothetical protein